MAGERTLPGGAQLEGYWTPASDGWEGDGGVDGNWRKIGAGLTSVLVVKSQTTALPGVPVLGDIYIVQDGDANQKQVAVWDGAVGFEAWNYYPPFEGLEAYPLDTGNKLIYDGVNWVPVGGGAAKLLTVGRATTVSVANSTNTILAFDLEVTDTEAVYDTGVNPSRLPALGTGPHKLSLHIEWDLHNANQFYQHIVTLNRAGSTVYNKDFPGLETEGLSYSAGTNISRHIHWEDTIPLTAGDYVEVLLWQSSGAARNVGVDTRVTLEFKG